MEVASSNYLPGDPRLIDNIVYELKSQGIFDNFRKECISDVDTKPAYQNLRQRVEGSVSGFLKTQQWSPDMNKNQVREMLRKTISESGFLETGVERIVDQVVNPKINSIFFPQVENVVYKFLGIEKSAETSSYRRTYVATSNITIPLCDLLPNDLEAVSPENEATDKELTEQNDESVVVNTENDLLQVEDIKIDDEESPPFEALEEKATFFPQEESSIESHLSGMSELTNHDSNHSFVIQKTIEMDITNEELQNSTDNATSNISVYDSRASDVKMDINEDSNYFKAASDRTDSNSQITFDNVLKQVADKEASATSTNSSNNEPVSSTEDNSKHNKTHELVSSTDDSIIHRKNHEPVSSTDESNKHKKNSKNHISDKHQSEKPHKSSSDKHKSSDKRTSSGKYSSNDKHTSKDHKSEKVKKSDRNDKKYKSSSSKSSHDHEKHEKDRHSSSSKRSDSKSDKDRKSDQHLSSSKHSNSHNRDKSSRSSESSDQKNDLKHKGSSRKSRSPTKKDSNEQTNKEANEKHTRKGADISSKDQKERDKSDSKKHSSEKEKSSRHSSHSKSRSESKSHHSSKNRQDSKNNSKHEQTKSEDASKTKHKNEVKHNSKTEKPSTPSSKKDKHIKDKTKSKKDDHCKSKNNKYHRRSTDRDSSDGRSGTHSSSSSFTETLSSSKLQKCSDDSSKINSGSNSGDSGNSDKVGVIISQGDQNVLSEFSHVKLIKPKFASNIFEARRLLKIRKRISKIEKQNQLKLLNHKAIVNATSVVITDASENVLNQINHKALEQEDVSVKKNIVPSKKHTDLNMANSMDRQEDNASNNFLTNNEKPVDAAISSSSLSSSVISKESWDAIEAKLNSTNILNIDYNSYVDVSEQIENSEYTLPADNSDSVVKVSSSIDINLNTTENPTHDNASLNYEKHESNEVSVDSQETVCVQSSDKQVVVPKQIHEGGDINKNCLYLVPEVLPETQRYFDKIASRISLLEEEIARRTKLLILHMESQKNKDAEIDISKKLPKIDILDVNTDNEYVISPSKSAKCHIKQPHDVHNNNKRKLQFDEVEEIDENQTTKLNTPENHKNLLKGKKMKLVNNSVGDVDFTLPLSPADSENSVSSNSEKQRINTRPSARRTSSRQQSYANDDLYKPRLRFTSSRRRVVTSTASDEKN